MKPNLSEIIDSLFRDNESSLALSNCLSNLEILRFSSKMSSVSFLFSLESEKYLEMDSVHPQTFPVTPCSALVTKKFWTVLLLRSILSAAISNEMKTAVFNIIRNMFPLFRISA